MKKVILYILSFVCISLIFMNFITSSDFLVVPTEFMSIYKKISLTLLIAVIASQLVAFKLGKGRFWYTLFLQLSSFFLIKSFDRLVNIYIDNMNTSYPIWSDIHWIIVMDLALVLLIWYIIKLKK